MFVCVFVPLLQVPSQLFCGASNWRYFSVPGESECVNVFLGGGMYAVCVYARLNVCVYRCVIVSQTSIPASPHLKA